MFLFMVSCAHDPYLLRTLDDGVVGSRRYMFAYGKYCGPGYPANAPNTSRFDRLTQVWPPVDDLDAACYAHDYCYAANYSKTLCDFALWSTIESYRAI